MGIVLLIFTLTVAVTSTQVHSIPSYFFLCSYHGNTEQPSLESKEVTVHISIDGDPSYYIPEEKYKVRIGSSKNFDSIQITGLYTMKSDQVLPSLAVGAAEPFGNQFTCSIVHSHISHEPRNQLEFLWSAPPNGTGCISFLASASLGQLFLFKQVTVLQLCEEGASENNPPRPTLASLHDNGVIFRDDFDSTKKFNSGLWSNCDGVGVSSFCGVIQHDKAGVACILDAVKERQLITVPLNLTTASVLQFSIGSGTCPSSDGTEYIQLFYGIDECSQWIYFDEFKLPLGPGIDTHVIKIPLEAEQPDTCLRWLQPLQNNSHTYIGCWAIDNVMITNTASPPTSLVDQFDPVEADNWLFFPGAQIRHKCHSDSNALVFDNDDQEHNFVVTRDLDLEVYNLEALLTQDFEGGFSQRQELKRIPGSIVWKVHTVTLDKYPDSWLIEGGELNTTCGTIYSGKAVVMSGRSKIRKLCTPYMDLKHAGTIHFYYSQGNSACSTFNENWSKVFCFAEDRFGHSVQLRMLKPENNENPEHKILPIPPRARSVNSRICWIQKQHEGENKDVWAVDHVQVFRERPPPSSQNYVQFMVNMNCGLHAGNSSMELEYSVDHGENWYPLYQQCLSSQCQEEPHTKSSTFTSLQIESWMRATMEIPVGAMAPHTRFRWRQTSAVGHSGWGLDKVFIGYCLQGCNGHGDCTLNGCKCDLGFKGPSCSDSEGPLPTILIDTMTTIPSIVHSFPVVRGGSLGFRCGVLASGKAVVFHKEGARILETMNLNTSEAKYLQFNIRVGSNSDVGDCPPPNNIEETILLQASCNGGIDWLTMRQFYGESWRQASMISIPITPAIQQPVCKFRWVQLHNSGPNQDVWALDDISVTRVMYNTLQLNFSDLRQAGLVLDVHMGTIGSYCGTPDVLSFGESSLYCICDSFTEPYQEGEHRYVMTNSMQITSSYMLQFDLKMGCGQDYLKGIDNLIHLEYSLDHGMSWALIREGCWPPRMCEDYHRPTQYHASQFGEWKRVTMKLPEHTWSGASRFRWRQFTWASRDSWALDNIYIGQQCPDLCKGHGYCLQGDCRCDDGYYGKTCKPQYLLPTNLTSDFSLMSQLDSNWLTVGGGAIVGAHDGCGTILSGESLYFSKDAPRELVTKDLDSNTADYIEFYLRMGRGSDRLCYGNDIRDNHVLLQYSNDGGIMWHLLKELQADDYVKSNFVHVDIPAHGRTDSTRFRLWQPVHNGDSSDQWAIDQVSVGSYEHMKELQDDFEILNDGPDLDSHPVWQLVTEGMYTPYCSSRSDTLMFADQLNDKVAMTKDLQLNEGDLVQFRINVGYSRSFSYQHPVLVQYSQDAVLDQRRIGSDTYKLERKSRINVGCSRSFSYHHPVLVQFSQDAGMTWDLVERPCYVRDSCHDKYTEGSVYYTGTHGHWVLVVLPLPKHVIQKPVHLRWWQKGGPASSFALDDVYIGPPCPDMCNGHGVCDHGRECRCDPGYKEASNCASDSPYPLYIVDRFDNRNRVGTLWAEVMGGQLGIGCGILDGGSSLYFSDEGTRLAKTVPINTEQLKILQFTARVGSSQDYKGCRKPTSRDEAVIVDYSTDGGITWTVLRTLDPTMLSQGPETVSIELPDQAKSISTILRWWQPVISPGAERAQWAIDSVVIAVNESATLGFEEHFNPMQPDIWYRAMNAVPRITCSSRNDALVFSKNGGKMRYAETWDYQVTDSTFLQFDIAMACSGTYSTLYKVMLQYSTDMGSTWSSVIEGCLPPRTDCRGYQQSSEFQSDQHTNWTRTTLYLPEQAVSTATRFRWLQDQVTLRGNVWAIDNIYLGEGCPWLCSGHGYCHQGQCVCDKGYKEPYCLSSTPLPMTLREDFNQPLLDSSWPEVYGGEVTNLCGELVSGNAVTFFKNNLRLVVSRDVDVSMATFIQFTFKYGCQYGSSDWPMKYAVLLQYSTNGGIGWHLMQEVHYKNITHPRYFSLRLPTPAQSNSTRFRFWQPQHAGHMNSVWSVDNFYVGGNVMLPDSIKDTFDTEINPQSWLFWPGGERGTFCSFNTRADTKLSGSSSVVFSRGAGEHSITTQDILVNEVTVVQFDINVGCTSQASRFQPVRLEYSSDFGRTWQLVVKPCGQSTIPCQDPVRDPSIYYAGESPFWRRVIIPLYKLQIYGPVRFRWYQGHFTVKDTIPEWALDNVYIGMQCYQNCRGHGSCEDGMFCKCDSGYSGLDCEISEHNHIFLKEEFEGPNNPLEASQWLYTSGGVKSTKCGVLMTGNSLYFSQTGARHATTHDLDLSKANIVQFYLRRGCTGSTPSMQSDPVSVQYSRDGGITWITLKDFVFMKETNKPEYTAVELPVEVMTEATRLRWWQANQDGAFIENWAIDQVYIGGDISGRQFLEDDLTSKYNDHWLMYPGAEIQSTCGNRASALHFTDKSSIRYAVTGDVRVTASTYLQFSLSMGCIFNGNCYEISLEFSKDFGKTWQLVQKECLLSNVNCAKYHRGSVFTSDVYHGWNRVSFYLPPQTRSLHTRFKWIQHTPYNPSQTWALTEVYIGDECPCSCAGHGRCHRGHCVCYPGWIEASCDKPTSPLLTSIRDSFSVPPGKDPHVTVRGGQLSTECGVLAAGYALHFKGACTRELITCDLDLQSSTLIQFYFKFGCINPPTKRDHNVLVDFSTNGGTTWTNMAELYYDQYREAMYVMVELPKEARHNGARIRWWQPSHGGQSMSDWAVDNVYIGGKDVNPNEVKDDFTDREKESAWIETDNAVIGEYCGSSFAISGEASDKESVVLTTIDTTIETDYILQFSISVGCQYSRIPTTPIDKRVAPVYLQFSTDFGMHWNLLVDECLPFYPACKGRASTPSIYYATAGWRRVTIQLSGAAVSKNTRFQWKQTVRDAVSEIPQDWAIDDLYIGPACTDMCSGHGQCDFPLCICDRGYYGDACQYGVAHKTYLKDTFNQPGDVSRDDWFQVQGGSIADGCALLSDGYSLTFSGSGQRQLVTVDLDLRNARFIQYLALIGGSSSKEGCGEPTSRNDSVVLQYSTNAGITWHTLHVLDFSMYWSDPHYDYIDLPLSARSPHTRFRWWQPVATTSEGPRPSSWSLDNVYIGGFEINPSYFEEHFEDVVNEQTFEFWPNSQQWDDVCEKSGGSLVWMESAGRKHATTQQLIIQEGYMLQFKIMVSCGAEKYNCTTDKAVVLQYNKDPHQDVWRTVFPRCMRNAHETNMDCPPYRFSVGSVYTANSVPRWTRVTLQLPPKVFSSNTRFRWAQEGTDVEAPSWGVSDIYIGEKCPHMCHGRGDCVAMKCECDEQYSGESCEPDKQRLKTYMVDGFEGALLPSKWERVDGQGEANGCGTLLPFAHGKNLYFDGCGVRQAVTTELDLSKVSKVMFVLQIGSVKQSSKCNVNIKSPIASESVGWVFLQYTRNKGIDWFVLADHDPRDFLRPRRVGYALPRDARAPGVQFRWWQPEHGGQGYDQWALDYVEIIKGRTDHNKKSASLQNDWLVGK